MVITVQSCSDNVEAEQAVREGVARVLALEGRNTAEVSVYITDDVEIAELNGAYRGQTGPTDVLAFSQQERTTDEPDLIPSPEGEDLLGDVVISLETASRQAEQRGVPLASELRELAAHGTLHLLGYDDDTEAGAELMRMRVAEALSKNGS